ncbi:MAG: kinase-regulated stress-responsive transcription factor skn7 [Thelocarpon impressellum]|nr:MAG: kinase-regulated stress-responsive transcription factor skn7 [Thelocarpon impressellum]
MDNSSQSGASAAANSSSDFVRKLYKMLEDPSYDQVVRWGNDGESFVVLENEKFTKAILPKHFKHSNFASFVRQLNKYDFHKVRHNNEESGQSPYGAGAWEFKHPEFKMNSRDSLDNIRRKAPAPRKPAQMGEELVPGTQHIDLVNTQLVAMQQQLQQLSDRYNELSVHHSMLLTEIIGMQKTVVNHEHVMQNVMSYLHSADTYIRDQRRNSRDGAAFASGGQHGAIKAHGQGHSPIDDVPPSPLQNAEKILNDSSADTLLNNKNLEHMNELYRQSNGLASASPAESAGSRNGGPVPSHGAPPTPALPSHSVGYSKANGDMQDAVYPVGSSNGIDPLYSEHIHNIPYPMPVAGALDGADPRSQYGEGRKKSTAIDPGWIRAPQILLVEDDPTCRRIGGKFLYSFKCSIDSALDGLEAVNKMNAGSKYDLVLMDIIMPNLDGISATSLIRNFDSTPIIAMTSNIRSDDISMYFQHGMNDVLPKPFTKEGLLTMLEKHLGHLKVQKDIEPIQPQPISHGSVRPPIKDETSPLRSPATSNWHSPSQMPGVSPTSHGINDEYLNALRGSAAYNMEAPMQQDGMAFHSAGQAMAAPRQGAHRRQISDISAGDEVTNEAKRQRMFATPPTSQPIAVMHPGRQGV